MVSSMPRPYFTPGKDLVPIVQEAGWAPGPVWTGRKSRPTRIRSPDRPALSQLLYRLSNPAHTETSRRVNHHRYYVDRVVSVNHRAKQILLLCVPLLLFKLLICWQCLLLCVCVCLLVTRYLMNITNIHE